MSRNRRKPIYGADGKTIVGYEDATGAGQTRGGNVRTDANRKPKRAPKPKPAPHYDTASDAGTRSYIPPPPKPRGPDPQVVRRQRLLRASGFDVPVDGRWAGRSQTAWEQYQRGRRPLVEQKQAQARAHAIEQRKAFDKRMHSTIDTLRTQANLSATGPANVQTDAASKQLPQSVVRAELRRKAKIALSTGFAAREQGGPKLTPSMAVQAERQLAQQQARVARNKDPKDLTLDDLVALTIDPVTGKLDPRDAADVLRVQRWLKAHGHPTLPDSGVFDRATFEALRKSYTIAARQEEARAHKQIVHVVKRVHQLHPEFHIFATPDQLLKDLQGGGTGAKLLWSHLIDLYRDDSTDMLAVREAAALKLSREAFGPFADSLFKTPSRQLLRSVQMAYGGTSAGDIAGALASSNTYKHLKQTLQQIQQEEKRLFEAKAKAANERPWWKGALDYTFVKPSEFVRKEFWVRAEGEANFLYGLKDRDVDRIVSGFAGVFGGPVLTRLSAAGGQDIAHRKEAEAARLQFEKDHPWLALAMSITADPWNFVPGAGALTKSMVALERFGYAVDAEQKLVQGYKAYAKGKGALALTLPARIGRESTFALRVAGYQYTPEYLKMVGKKLVLAKSASISAARAMTNQMLKHHFQPGPGVEDLGIKIDPKAVKALNELGPDAERHALIWLKNAYKMFLDGKISVYSNVNREELTSLAAGLEANFAEYARYITVEQKAITAGEARRSVLANETNLTAEQIDEEVKIAIRRERNNYGSYIAGAPHPWFGKEVEDLVQQRLSRFRDTMFPILQSKLERDLDELGEGLFDASGRWVGRSQDIENNFRRLARNAFTDATRNDLQVRNPVQGMTFTQAEARDLQNQEIGRSLGRLYGWAAREAAAGRAPTEERVTELAQKIRDEVTGSWEKRLDGKWEDSRDFFEVPDLYARQLKQLYEGVDPEDIPDVVREMVAQVSDEPGKFVTGPIQTELRNLVWGMDVHTGFEDVKRLMNDVHPHLRPTEFDFEAAQQFTKAIDDYSKALGEAWAHHYPQALRKQYAYWYAMSQAQGLPMKLMYKGLSGALQLWIFATLPLRPGWAFRNVVDNTAKVLMAGVKDPRIFFLGAEHPGSGIKSIFELGFDKIGQGIWTMDRMFGTEGHLHWLTMQDMFFDMASDTLGRIFSAHNIEVPQDVIESSLFRPWDDQAHIYNGVKIPAIVKGNEGPGIDPEDPGSLVNHVKMAPRRFQNGVWELMAQRPESYFKRMLYRDTYAKAVKRMEADPQFWVHPPQGWNTTNIDVGYDQRVLNRVREDLGLTDKPMEFHVNLVDDPGDDIFTYGSHRLEAINGEPTHIIEVNIPRSFVKDIATQREAQWVTDFLTGTFLHELRHANQFEESIAAIGKKLAQNKSAFIPHHRFNLRYSLRKLGKMHHNLYQALPEEYAARLFERMNTNEYRGLIRASGPSQKQLDRLPKDAVNRGLIERKAFEEAWAAVDKHLFDYSRETTIEDNLRLVFPFVQFWRKNTMLWAEHFVNKPWLLASLAIAQDQLNNNIHADLPEWSRRYISAEEVGNGISHIPGLSWLGNYVADQDVMYDPMNFLSFAPMYRAFKNENPLLPADKAGWKFIAPMIDALNDWGLSMNPLLFRKPLEVAGVANYRAWQSIFPETSLIEAFTRKYMNERFPNGLNIEALALDPLFHQATQKSIEKSFNQYVQLEMANQKLRGETPNRARAERKIQDFYWMQAVVGFFSGAYVKRMTPEDFTLYKMADDFHKGTADYASMTGRQKAAYRLYKLRKIDRVEFDKYVQSIPLIEAYYKLHDYKLKEQMKQEHPEIIPWVEPMWAGRGEIPKYYVKTLMLVQDTQFVRQMSDLADDLDLPFAVRKYAQDVLVTPTLQEFWDRNTTPQKMRDRQLRLLYFRHMKDLNDQFHEIPLHDYDAQKGYLAQNPMLVHFWHQNDSASDEYLGLINSANADLRQVYFEYADAEDWDGATKFLHQYPFIFEFTKAADRVDDEGNWISKAGTGHGTTQHARDYLRAKAALDKYFALDTQGRRDLLNSGSAEASLIKWYFSKYGRSGRTGGHGLSEHATDYLAVKSLLDKFFGMPELDQVAWLERDGDEQKRVKAYFKKWGSKDGQSEHSRDFQKNKPYLDHYFNLPKPERRAWLEGGTPAADAVLAYFKRWSKMNHIARLWAKLPESKNPELNRRIQFWHKYFSLMPDKRPAYAIKEAEKHGVFIWGPLSKKNREERESEYLRKAYAHGISPHAAMYLYVKPLLDEWHKLKDRTAKRTFLAANPELGKYLDHFSKGSATGDPKLDKLMKGYFQLPDGSPLRSEYLQKHPEVQDYFDLHSSPAQRAMHRLLEIYFRRPPSERKDFLVTHPEISAYFDARKREKDSMKGEGELFGSLDPRLAGLREWYATDVSQAGTLAARREQDKRNRSKYVAGLEVRRDRNARF